MSVARALRLAVLALTALASTACVTLSQGEQARVREAVEAARDRTLTCARADACARPSPLRALGVRAMGGEDVAASRSGPAPLVAATDTDMQPVADATAPASVETTQSPPPPSSPPPVVGSASTTTSADTTPEGMTTAATITTAATTTAATPPAPGTPQHYALILDYGQDALIARLDLIRGATRSIDLQTYIFDEDDAGHLVLDELIAAARRGVKVRILVDQLAALKRVDTLAALTAAHVNFEMRLYNPVLGRARFGYPMYAVATICCFRRLNQRMHNKLLVVDDLVAITGGRNYQNDYYDWDDRYNFRDRDILLAGPVVREMTSTFEAFWNAPHSTDLTRLSDVGERILADGVPALVHPEPELPRRTEAILRDADDAELVRSRFVDAAIPVRNVSFIADPPDKHVRDSAPTPSSQRMRALIASSERRVLLQTPYLVLSRPAQQLFRELQARAAPPRVQVSTNSLAATDAFIPYALSYKYKRRYLRDFKFEIHEFKPFPQDAPIDLEATGAVDLRWHADGSAEVLGTPRTREREHGNVGGLGSGVGGSGSRSPDRPTPLAREYSALRYSRRGANERVPVRRDGVRFGLHAKSLVIDDRIGVIGTHNFDPRGENYNTETVVVIDDPAFAHALASSIERDMLPANAWTIARRDKPKVFSGLEYSLAKISEHMPVFDFWPVRYATSYEFKPGPDCPVPLSPRDPQFRRCHEPVGDFPEVDLVIRPLTRIFTAFGAGLAPIL